MTRPVAVVTGASSGIGAAFARALAKRGSGVILVARRLDRLQDEIAVDVANLVDISRAFIEPLRREGRGILVNVASVAAYAPSPDMAVYAACKAFVLSFTEALWFESRSSGLRVLSLAPGLTRTEFFDDLPGGAYNGSYQTPEQVVETGMRSLDRGNRRPSIVSGRGNALAAGLGRFFTRRRAVLLSGSFGARSRATGTAGRAGANRM